MKTLRISLIIASVATAAIAVAVIEILFQPAPPGGYPSIQTDTVPHDSNFHECNPTRLQGLDPGPMGGFMCPIEFFYGDARVAGNAGFDEVCYDKRYSAGNYILKAGHEGSITYTIHPYLPPSYAIHLPHWNITNSAHFSHYKPLGGGGVQFTYTDSLPGVWVSFEPRSEVLWPWSTTGLTATIHSDANAQPGSHWVFLPPGVCSGGLGIIVTILNSSETR